LLDGASAQKVADEINRVREEVVRESDAKIAVLDEQLVSVRSELVEASTMVQSLQNGAADPKLEVAELQATILLLETERDDGLHERDLAVQAKSDEFERALQMMGEAKLEGEVRETALAGQIEQLGQEMVQAETLRREADEQTRLEIDARVKVEETVKELNARLEVEQQEASSRLELAVSAERELVTADLEARAKASIEEARTETAEKTLAIESLQAEIVSAQASSTQLNERLESEKKVCRGLIMSRKPLREWRVLFWLSTSRLLPN
jgi:hypothetical protein